MSNRPTTLLKNGTLYWVLSVYNSSGVLVDADSTPSVTVRKNGSATSESVTVTKRGSSTGLYDCSLNPSLEAEGDTFHLEEELDISSVTYNNTWSVVVTESMITSTEVSTAVWDVPTSSYLGAGTFGLRFAALNTTTPDNTSITAIKSVTDQMVFTIANELDCNAVTGGGGGDATAANQTAISNAIASLNDFDPASDDVAVVTTVSNMRGTDNANTVVPDNAGVSANGIAISALNDFDPATDTVITDTASRNASKADVSSLATATVLNSIGSAVTGNASAIAVVDTVVDAIKVVTDALPNSGALSDLATAASISSLNDFDPASDAVANVTTVGSVTNAVTTSSAADVTAIKSVTDKIDTALVQDGSVYQYTTNALENAPSGGGGLTQADVRAAVGLASANLDTQLSTIDAVVDAVLVDTGTDIPASISALNDFDPATQDVTTDAASRTASQADVSLLATAVSISALNDFDPSSQTVTTDAASRTASQADVSALATASALTTVDTVVDGIKAVTDKVDTALVQDGSVYQYTANALENGPSGGGGGGGDDAATIYTYFTSSSRQDSFKTDLTSLNDITAADVFTYFTAFSREDLFKADVSSMSTTVSSIDSKVDTLDSKINTIDNVVDAVLSDSSTLASIESKIDTVDTVVDSILLDTAEIATVDGKVNGIQSSVSSVPATLQTIEGKIDTVDTVVDSILVDTATIDIIHSKINTIDNVVDAVLADSSTLATIESKIDIVDTVVDSIKLDTDDLDSKLNTIDNVVDAVLVDTSELQQNQSNSATASNIYQYFTDASRADVFKSDVSDLSVIRTKTDRMVFSTDNQLYVSVSSGGGDTAETIYNYFTSGVRENEFKDGDAYGAGAVSHTVTIQSDGAPVSGTEVWVSQDVTGVSIVAGTLHTNTAGQVTFMLDPGSYYLWASKSGVQFSNPQVFTVS